MSLNPGNASATSGMAQSIYDHLRPALEESMELSEEELEPVRESWQKMSHAIAEGVIEHLLANLEVHGIETRGNVGAAVSGTTGAADPASHTHAISLNGVASDVTFTQNNDGTGRIR